MKFIESPLQAPRLVWKTILMAFMLSLVAGGCGTPPNTPSSEQNSARTGGTPSPRDSQDRCDLERDESHGGHTLKRHVGRTDYQLRERLARERNISAASTWTDRQTAEETVATGLSAERLKIERWKARGYPRPNLALHFNAGRPIGRSMRRGERKSVPCASAVIVLRADGPDSFYVLTAYPEDRE